VERKYGRKIKEIGELMKLKPSAMFTSKKITFAFFVSHLAGWILANLQTIWIVYEIRKMKKELSNRIK